jgi:tetratricopeptide (TPR) repeat protein
MSRGYHLVFNFESLPVSSAPSDDDKSPDASTSIVSRNTLRSRARQALNSLDDESMNKDRDSLVHLANLSVELADHHELHLAEEITLRIVGAAREVLGKQHQDTLGLIKNLGMLYFHQRRYTLASDLLEEALDGMKASGNQPDLLECMFDLAQAYNSQCRLKEAESVLKDLWDIRKRGSEDPENDLDMIPTLINLGFIYMKQNLPDKAEPLAAQILQVRRRRLGERHPETVASTRELAHIHLQQGRLEETGQLLSCLVQIMEEEPSDKDAVTLYIMVDLALALHDQRSYQEAERFYRQACKLCERCFGDNHKNTLVCMTNRASNLVSLDQLVKAETLQLRVIKAQEEALGKSHPETLRSMARLAPIYNRKGRYWEALEPGWRIYLHLSTGTSCR